MGSAAGIFAEFVRSGRIQAFDASERKAWLVRSLELADCDLATLHTQHVVSIDLGTGSLGTCANPRARWALSEVAYRTEPSMHFQTERFPLSSLTSADASDFCELNQLPDWLNQVIDEGSGSLFTLTSEEEAREESKRKSHWLNWMRAEGGQQIYSLPLRKADGCLGVLSFVSSRGMFQQEQRDFLAIFAGIFNGMLTQQAFQELQVTERRLIAEHAISKILAEAESLETAMPSILQSLSSHLGAAFSAIWFPNADKSELRCAEVHLSANNHPDLAKFAEYSKGFTFTFGQGLPGRVWESGYPLWINDVGNEVKISRGVRAHETGLVSAVALPLRLHGEVLGVIEVFFASQIREDAQLLRTLFSVGNEIGHFVQSERATNRLRMRESLLSAVSDYAQIGLVVIDSDHRYRFVNSYYCEMQSLSEAEIIGKTVESVLGAIYQEVRPRLERAFAGERLSFEIRLPRTVGKSLDHWYAVAYQPFDDEHAGKCVLSVIVDITERKSAEERKDEFLAVLGHELRNPLAAITGGVQVLDMLDGFNPDAKEMHAVIGRQALVMQRLIDDLLDVTRISRGKVHLRMAPFDLLHLLQNIMEDQRRLIEERGLKLEVEYPITKVVCMGDTTRLNQAVVNVLQNAIKFTEPGGSIRVALVKETEFAALTIADTGMGMTGDVLKRIFEPFSQAQPGDMRSGGGLGLGLALVKGLVTLHNGEVTAQSDGEGKGSTFTIRIPLVAEAPKATTVDTSPPSYDALRILLVDDRRDAILPALTLLKRDGHAVRAVADGEAALNAVQELMPDIIFCDIGLPGMSGFEVARQLRQHPSSAHCFLVALSGFGQEQDRRQALDAGFDLHLTKPISLDKLRHVIQLARWKPA